MTTNKQNTSNKKAKFIEPKGSLEDYNLSSLDTCQKYAITAITQHGFITDFVLQTPKKPKEILDQSIEDFELVAENETSVYASDLPEFQKWGKEVTLGRVMKNWREAEDLTQEDVARLLGVSKQVLSAYENNRKLPSIKKTIEIAEKLGASAKMWLIYRFETELRLQGVHYTVKLE
jgi:DNA-binding XRE family transcriptional regulator